MSNLPPGVNESMLPGNRPEDVLLDRLIEGPIGEALGDMAGAYRFDGDVGADGRQVFQSIDLETAEQAIALYIRSLVGFTRKGEVVEPDHPADPGFENAIEQATGQGRR